MNVTNKLLYFTLLQLSPVQLYDEKRNSENHPSMGNQGFVKIVTQIRRTEER